MESGSEINSVYGYLFYVIVGERKRKHALWDEMIDVV
jgi:hypothetical protein